MSTLPFSHSTSKTAVDLIAVLRTSGWISGPPIHLERWAEVIDRGVCRRLRCPRCRTAGLAYEPFHRARAYRVIAVCERCGFGEEV